MHLNLPGRPEGSAFTMEMIEEAIDEGIKTRLPVPEIEYFAFVGMRGAPQMMQRSESPIKEKMGS